MRRPVVRDLTIASAWESVAGGELLDAAFDHLVLQNAGPDPEGPWTFWTDELQPRLRELTPGPA